LDVSERRMPSAVFLGCTSFSTSTRFSDGSSLFAIAARLGLQGGTQHCVTALAVFLATTFLLLADGVAGSCWQTAARAAVGRQRVAPGGRRRRGHLKGAGDMEG
jgi:DNA polymerase III epsilon subunit-like protein